MRHYVDFPMRESAFRALRSHKNEQVKMQSMRHYVDFPMHESAFRALRSHKNEQVKMQSMRHCVDFPMREKWVPCVEVAQKRTKKFTKSAGICWQVLASAGRSGGMARRSVTSSEVFRSLHFGLARHAPRSGAADSIATRIPPNRPRRFVRRCIGCFVALWLHRSQCAVLVYLMAFLVHMFRHEHEIHGFRAL